MAELNIDILHKGYSQSYVSVGITMGRKESIVFSFPENEQDEFTPEGIVISIPKRVFELNGVIELSPLGLEECWIYMGNEHHYLNRIEIYPNVDRLEFRIINAYIIGDDVDPDRKGDLLSVKLNVQSVELAKVRQ